MQEEQFITTTELNSYINSGISEAERIIHNLYEDYFLTTGALTVHGAGLPWFTLPSDIYANKIRKVVYDDGNNVEYIIPRIRKLEDIYALDDITASPENSFAYLLLNDLTNGVRLRLYPTPASTPVANITVYYIRNAKQLSADNDVHDIPEFENFIVAYAKIKCLQKEGTSPLLQVQIAELQNEKSQMIQTLSNMVPDDDDNVIPDMSFYSDFDCNEGN
jgi:hypothetical protein